MLVDYAGARRARDARRSKRVLLEGAQGTLLDVDHGTYPFVTSSTPDRGRRVRRRGHRPDAHRRGRRHREGLHDARRRRPVPDRAPRRDRRAHPQGRRRVRLGHRAPASHRLARSPRAPLRGRASTASTALAITKLDVLTGLDEVKVCVAYETQHGRTSDLPIDELDDGEARLPELPGLEGGARRGALDGGSARGGAHLPRVRRGARPECPLHPRERRLAPRRDHRAARSVLRLSARAAVRAPC